MHYKDAGSQIASCLIWVKNALVGDKIIIGDMSLFMDGKKAAHYFIDDRTQDTIWEYNKPKNEEHPTMKPLELCGRAISNSSKGW